MLVFESMISSAAEKAGMKTPPPELLDEVPGAWSREDYPHFYVFCRLQLCRPMHSYSEHWDNARVIAAIPEEELKGMTVEDFAGKGVVRVIG